MTRDIGLDVTPPETTCDDDNCPFHGTLSVRGQVLEARVSDVKMDRTIVVERRRLWRLPRFERFEKRTSRTSVHKPPCIELDLGDHVKIAECRPLSKTKSFVVVEAREGKRRVYGQEADGPLLEEDASDAEDEDEDEEEQG